MKVGIITDSTFYLREEYIIKNNIGRVPLSIIFENTIYTESNDNKKINREIIEKIEDQKVIPKTSQPTPKQFIEKFKEYEEQGYDKIIVLCLSSKLSGTYQGAVNAANIYKEEGKCEINVYDTLLAGQASNFILYTIVDYINENGDITHEKTQEIINFYIEETHLYLVVDSLDFLSYGGRISPSIASIGNIFGIKPVLRLVEGELKEESKARSSKKAFKYIYDLYEEEIKEDEYYVDVADFNDEKMRNKVIKELQKIKSKDEVQYMNSMELGPIIGIHVGTKTIAATWSKKYKTKGKI